jgi:hypothetical protein
MIGWAKIDPDTPITPAFACEINKGILIADGTERKFPAHIYMHDALLLGWSKQQILMRLAALIEAIFVVMGKPDTIVRQCHLAMDKWSELIAGPVLGLDINTYRLSFSIPMQYVQEVLKLLNNTWHAGQKQSIVSEAQKLTGKLEHLAKGATWIFYLLSHLYALIAHAPFLRTNVSYLNLHVSSRRL